MIEGCMRKIQKLLVSVRGPLEAITAAKGGAGIADVEYPASALGTPYPLNILSIKDALSSNNHNEVLVSTNIGEAQTIRASSCQAALGVATAGADLIKFGLAEMSLEAASYLGTTIVRTVRNWFPQKKLIPAVFVDPDLQRYFNPFSKGVILTKNIEADALLLDTYNKLIGKGLLDYCSPTDLKELISMLHDEGKEAWLAGSITLEELPTLWRLGADVICVRGAACQGGKGNERFGAIDVQLVQNLVATIPA